MFRLFSIFSNLAAGKITQYFYGKTDEYHDSKPHNYLLFYVYDAKVDVACAKVWHLWKNP